MVITAGPVRTSFSRWRGQNKTKWTRDGLRETRYRFALRTTRFVKLDEYAVRAHAHASIPSRLVYYSRRYSAQTIPSVIGNLYVMTITRSVPERWMCCTDCSRRPLHKIHYRYRKINTRSTGLETFLNCVFLGIISLVRGTRWVGLGTSCPNKSWKYACVYALTKSQKIYSKNMRWPTETFKLTCTY